MLLPDAFGRFFNAQEQLLSAAAYWYDHNTAFSQLVEKGGRHGMGGGSYEYPLERGSGFPAFGSVSQMRHDIAHSQLLETCLSSQQQIPMPFQRVDHTA